MKKKSRKPIESLPSSGILIKILITNKKPHPSFNKSLKPTKSYPIKTKGKPTIFTATMAPSHLEVQTSQASEDLTLISIMLKMFSGTFSRKTLSKMTSLKEFSETNRKRRKLLRDSVAEDLVLLMVIHFFRVA
jgi:hypothetical protein